MKIIVNPHTFEMEYMNRKTREVFTMDPFSSINSEDALILWSAVKKIEEEKWRKGQPSS